MTTMLPPMTTGQNVYGLEFAKGFFKNRRAKNVDPSTRLLRLFWKRKTSILQPQNNGMKADVAWCMAHCITRIS